MQKITLTNKNHKGQSVLEFCLYAGLICIIAMPIAMNLSNNTNKTATNLNSNIGIVKDRGADSKKYTTPIDKKFNPTVTNDFTAVSSNQDGVTSSTEAPELNLNLSESEEITFSAADQIKMEMSELERRIKETQSLLIEQQQDYNNIQTSGMTWHEFETKWTEHHNTFIDNRDFAVELIKKARNAENNAATTEESTYYKNLADNMYYNVFVPFKRAIVDSSLVTSSAWVVRTQPPSTTNVENSMEEYNRIKNHMESSIESIPNALAELPAVNDEINALIAYEKENK